MESKPTLNAEQSPGSLKRMVRRLKCAFDKHELQIQFTIPSGKIITEQLSCVTCEHCGGKWATCLAEGNAALIPFWKLYSAEDEINMREQNERDGIA